MCQALPACQAYVLCSAVVPALLPDLTQRGSWVRLYPYLGLGAHSIAGEGILPLWETQVSDEQAVVGCEGFGEEMPIQSSVQEPYLCVWGDN